MTMAQNTGITYQFIGMNVVFMSVLSITKGAKKGKVFPLSQRGDSSGAIHNNQNDAVVVVMPMRNDAGTYQGLNPDFMQVQQKAA
jgi:hypothetical protein